MVMVVIIRVHKCLVCKVWRKNRSFVSIDSSGAIQFPNRHYKDVIYSYYLIEMALYVGEDILIGRIINS